MNNHLQISIEADDANWKQRCNKRMEELKNKQFPNQDAASQSNLLHKELLGEKKVMIFELYKAVENGNVNDFVQVLEQECTKRKVPLSAIFDKVTRAGDSLLHVAAHLGKEQIAELICDHFPELLTRRNIRGDSVLHVAVRSNSENSSNIVKVILSQNAIEKSKHDGVIDEEKLITRKKNEYGDTPLHEAVKSGPIGIVEDVLLEDESVVHNLNKSKRSPLFLAVVTGDKEILKLLLQVPFPTDLPLPQCLGNSPLHAAILERNTTLIKVILEQRPELVYLRDEDGGTPLHYATYIGYVEGFRTLLKKSLEKSDQTILERNKKGHLPIHLGCKRGHVKVVEEFFQHEWPNLNILLNQKGQNILHVAAKNGKNNVVQYLLKNKQIDEFTINEKDNDGNTPLHLASINLFPKVLYFITRDNRTNVNLTNNEGLTARDIVRLATKTQMTIRKFVANRVLKEAEVPMKVDDMLHSQHQQLTASKRDLSIKDLLNTFLVVATLMVTVTFAAAFTVPGGVYSSDDPNPKNRGMAVLAPKPLFWVFTTFNMIAMYSSVISCGLMLMALIFDQKLARITTILAMGCLVLSFLMVPVAFMAAVRLVVANNSKLALVITVIAAVYISLILLGLFFVFFPSGVRFILFSHVGSLFLRILIALIDYDDKPEDSSSKRANEDKDEDNEKEKEKEKKNDKEMGKEKEKKKDE